MTKPPQTILTISLELEMVVQHQPVRMDQTHNLTIATELRKGLSVTFTDPYNTSHHPLDPHRAPYSAPITHIVAAQPMLITTDSPECTIPVVDWIGDHPNPRHFLVTSRNGLHRGITDSMDMFSAGVVVKTPILRTGSWRFAVVGLVASLKRAQEDGGSLRVEFTPYCGLHVHIGRRGGLGLSHVKGMAKAVVVFEEDIEIAFHPEHRRGADVQTRVHADSNRATSESLRSLKTTLEIVGLIEAQESVSAVRSVVCDEDVGHEDFKYNFQSLVETGSVEFRQAQGTLDEKWVVEWVEMLIAFTKAAELVSNELFEEFAKAADRGENGLDDFLAWGGYVCRKHKGADESDEEEEENDEDADTEIEYEEEGSKVENSDEPGAENEEVVA